MYLNFNTVFLLTAACWCGVLGVDDAGYPDLSDRSQCSSGVSSSRSRVDTTQQLKNLRQSLRSPVDNSYQPLSAYIVPMDDEHQSEMISPYDELVRFISGFSGSAGVVIVTDKDAALWTDGRYFLQAEDQLDCNWILMKDGLDAPEKSDWLISKLKAGQSVGADGRRMPALSWLELKKQLAASNISLVEVHVNLVDRLWTNNRPEKKSEPLIVHPMKYAGKSWIDKVADVRALMEKEGTGQQKVTALLVTQLDEVAWLLNLRGADIPHTPEFKGYIVLEMDHIHLFVNSSQLTSSVISHIHSDKCNSSNNDRSLTAPCVTVHEYSEIGSFMDQLVKNLAPNTLVWVPSRWAYSGGASYDLYGRVSDEHRLFKPSPLIRLKGMKNPVEVRSMVQAHLRDSVAVCDFLAALEKSMERGEHWDELSVAIKLREHRAEQDLYKDISFSTISAYGPHGAIIHYKPTNVTNAAIGKDGLLLLDSGAQYLDGTTDVTRTMHYGTPTPYEREMYTRVLMGVIDLARVVFKPGTTDSRLDILARQHLFRVGLDYLHGTGHGIGIFLQVHESPTQLRVLQKEDHPMEEGMFFSNEPGYYEAGKFGIRLETIMHVTKASQLAHNFSGPYLQLEPVSLVPFERKLMQHDLLSADHIRWLNNYHSMVREKVGALMLKQGRKEGYSWLKSKTEPIPLNNMPSSAAKFTASTGLMLVILLQIFH